MSVFSKAHGYLKARLKAAILTQPHDLLLLEYFLWWSLLKRRPSQIEDLYPESVDMGFRPSEFKTSDTLFIMGSGWSINQITPAGWDTIARHDTFGLNFWTAHRHVPTLYFFEAANTAVRPWLSEPVATMFGEVAESRLDDYEKVPKILTDYEPARRDAIERIPSRWFDSTIAIDTIPAFARNRDEFARALRILDEIGLFDGDDLRHLLKYRATIVMLVGLAVRMRYRRVVLCGFDMSDPRYFYQKEDEYPHLATFRSSIPGPQHATAVQYPLMANVPECLDAMEEVILRPRGIEIFVENRCSALFPRFQELRAHDA